MSTPEGPGEGGWSKAVVKSRHPQIQIFTKIFEVQIVSCVLEDNIRLNNQS